MNLKVLVAAIAMAGVSASPALAAPEKKPNHRQFLKEVHQQAKLEAAAAATSDVGDPSSFGRYAKWLGLMSTGVIVVSEFPEDCAPDPEFPPGPDDHCFVLNAQPAPSTFTIPDAARMVMPAKSSFSLFCHWQTPVSLAVMRNNTATPIQNARFFATPSYTFQNPVLNDPALVNPLTGLPFGGQITISALVGIRHQQSLQPGDMVQQRDDETRACINGMISKRQLTETYGLTDAQATNFFKNDTAITMGLTIQATGVEFANLVYSTRWLGD